jgi:glycosyltransferase involved in cell wall biosynthesis
MKSVKVSIGILSYNNAAYLPTTLDSVLSQSYDDFEVIIVDDGSSDESLDIARKFEVADNRVKVFTHQNNINKGISATCNLAINKSQGEYIALLASDDAYYPYTIAEQVKVLQENPSVGLVCGNIQCMDAQGKLLPETLDEDIWSDSDYLKKMLLRNRIAAPTVMMRKVCYEQVGLFDEEILYNDYELWLRLLLFSEWKVKFINKALTLYRIHDTNVSFGISEQKVNSYSLPVYLKVESLLKQSNRSENSSEYKIVKNKIVEHSLSLFYSLAKEGKLPEAVNYLIKCLKYSPKTILKPRRFVSINYRLAQGFITSSISTFKDTR